MNERIRELAEQAWDATAVSPQFGHPISFAEKFSELIVRECAKVADIADENKCEWIGGNILTHFGVNYG